MQAESKIKETGEKCQLGKQSRVPDMSTEEKGGNLIYYQFYAERN